MVTKFFGECQIWHQVVRFFFYSERVYNHWVESAINVALTKFMAVVLFARVPYMIRRTAHLLLGFYVILYAKLTYGLYCHSRAIY